MDGVTCSLYRHYKGNVYEVLGVGEHTETTERFVVYRPREGGKIWIRPLSLFLETVLVDGVPVKRFEKL